MRVIIAHITNLKREKSKEILETLSQVKLRMILHLSDTGSLQKQDGDMHWEFCLGNVILKLLLETGHIVQFKEWLHVLLGEKIVSG